MDFKDYTVGALKTESRPESIIIDRSNFNAVLNALIGAGNLLDVIKKDSFYGLPKTQKKLNQRADKLEQNGALLKTSASLAVPIYHYTPDLLVVDNSAINLRALHGIVGIVTEAVEMLEALNKAIANGEQLDEVNLLEEFGDLAWYMAIAIDALGGDWNKILQTNLDKLAARNKGASFNADATINRDTQAERILLEDNFAPPDARARAEFDSVGGSDF